MSNQDDDRARASAILDTFHMLNEAEQMTELTSTFDAIRGETLQWAEDRVMVVVPTRDGIAGDVMRAFRALKETP